MLRSQCSKNLEHVPGGVKNIRALFEPIAHPVLRSFDPQQVSKLLKECERYKSKVEERRQKVTSMNVASYKVCIEQCRLDHMKFIGKFHEIASSKSVGIPSSVDIEKFIRGIVIHEEGVDINWTVTQPAITGKECPCSLPIQKQESWNLSVNFFAVWKLLDTECLQRRTKSRRLN